MQYFTLETACAINETGPIYPQIQKMSQGYDYKSDHSVRKLFKAWRSFPDFTPDLNSFLLHAKSRPTDFISNALSSRGIIVSEIVKSIFESFNTCPIAFYKATIKYKSDVLDNYYWMHIISDYTDFIDYPNSRFFIYKNFIFDLGDIKIESKLDLTNKLEEIKKQYFNDTIAIWAKSITLLPNFDKSLDFFEIGRFSSNRYISLHLKNALEKEKVSGYLLSTATNLNL